MRDNTKTFRRMGMMLGLWLCGLTAGSATGLMHGPVTITDQHIQLHWWLQGETTHTIRQVQCLANGTPIQITESRLTPDPLMPLCTLFMTDTSLSMKNQLQKQVVPLLTALIQAKPIHHRYALGRFDTGLEMLAPLTQNPDRLMQSLQQHQLKGQRTELFRSALTGLQTLDGCQGYRRILVILSDGDAEDLPGAYALDDVIEEARAQQTPLITVGFKDSIQQQNLRRLAEQSGGWYWLYQADEVVEFSRRLSQITDQGGLLRIDRSRLPADTASFKLMVAVDNDPPLSTLVTIDLPATESVPAMAWQTWLKQRFPTIPLRVWWMGLGTLVGLLALRRVFLRWRLARNSRAPEGNAPIQRQPLAFVEANDQVWVMDQYSISIGALPENDWVIDDLTVSRYQATLDFQDHQFHLTDRGSTNPSQVNGAVIQHCILQDGDELCFGDWQGRFRLPE